MASAAKRNAGGNRAEIVDDAAPTPVEDGIKVGSIVCLNSGGPRMTVVAADAVDLSVTWIPDNGSGHFSVASLPRACVRVMP